MFLFRLYVACYIRLTCVASEVCEGCYRNCGFTAQKVVVSNLAKPINVIATYVHLPLEAFVLRMTVMENNIISYLLFNMSSHLSKVFIQNK